VARGNPNDYLEFNDLDAVPKPPTGFFSITGWSASGSATVTPWQTSKSPGADTALENNGFAFLFDASALSSIVFRGIPVQLAVNVADTGYTDTLQGGYYVAPDQLWIGPTVGISLDAGTALDLGPAVATTGNQVSGYGTAAGIQVGKQSASDFAYSLTAGAILGSKANDHVVGYSYGIGSSGIENYGVIALGLGSDEVLGNNQVPLTASYGIINWGSIDTGGNSDTLSGSASLYGIYNSTGPVSSLRQPSILTGSGKDRITGTATGNNGFGIWNDGIIDMGKGNDICQALDASGGAGSFGGTGIVVLGSGKDQLWGFGSGTFYGDNLGQAAQAKAGKSGSNNSDSLYFSAGQTYVITATSTSLNGKTINGFTIASEGDTMTVYGFETFGTSASQQALAAGTYTL
jgi:hypothetical protein